MMEHFLALLFLLSAVVEPGASISCVSCMEHSLNCYGNLEECPSNYMCSSTYKITFLGDGKNLYQNIRSCVPKHFCSVYGTLSVQDSNIVMGISCCNKDACTPAIMARKPAKAEPNGVVCKTCVAGENDFCETNETIPCRGDENSCVNYGLYLLSMHDYHSYAFRGCGTQELCDINAFTASAYGVTVENRFTCTEAETDSGTEENIDTDSKNELTSTPTTTPTTKNPPDQ